MGQGQSVALRTIHGKYVTAAEEGGVIADQYMYGDDGVFEIHFISPLEVALRSAHSKWLCAEPSGYVVCDRHNRSDWEAFKMCFVNNGKVAFKAYNNNFLTSTQDGYLTANTSFVGEWEMYDVLLIDLEDGQISLLGVHGKYLSVDATGRVSATQKVVSSNQVAFKGPNGRWLAANPQGHISCNSETMNDRALFYILPAPDNRYSFRSCYGLFICNEPDGTIVADRREPQEWEAFAMEN